jgi:hypothetical protein
MRIGVRAGPVYASSSTRGCFPMITIFFLFFIPIALFADHPFIGTAIVVSIAALITWDVRRKRRRWRERVRVAEMPATVAAPSEVDTRVSDMLDQLTTLRAEGKVGEAQYERLRDEILTVGDEQ